MGGVLLFWLLVLEGGGELCTPPERTRYQRPGGTPMERTRYQRPRVPPLWMEKQTKNITFPRTSYAGGNQTDKSVMSVISFRWVVLNLTPFR